MTATVELTFEQLTDAVDRLPIDLQEALASRIAERLSISHHLEGIEHPPMLTEAEVHSILKHRLENPSPSRPWEEVKAEMQARLKNK